VSPLSQIDPEFPARRPVRIARCESGEAIAAARFDGCTLAHDTGLSMISGESTIMISRSVEAVFDFVAVGFFQNYPRWSPEVIELRSLSPGPMRVGTVGQQVRVDYGKRHAAMFRVTDFACCRRIAFEGLTSPFTIDYRFDGSGEATRVAFGFRLLRLNFFMRPFERRIRHMVDEASARMIENLKRVVESEVRAEHTHATDAIV
jgi:hypothetical protein